MADSFLLPSFTPFPYSSQINPFTSLFFASLQEQFVSLQLPTSTTTYPI